MQFDKKTTYKVCFGLLLGIVIIWGYSSYNKIVEANESVTTKWMQFEAQNQRRTDLIPKIIGIFKGYASEEQEILTNINEAQSKIANCSLDPSNLTVEGLKEYQKAQQELNLTLSKLLIAGKIYPDLKTNEHFSALQAELEGAENRVAVAKNRFSEDTKVYNTLISKFPGNIIASLFGFTQKPYFHSQENIKSKTINMDMSLVVSIIGVILFIWLFLSVYNKLVEADENVAVAWAQVETQYQQRADLIPNLVNTVKGYTTHEKETLTAIVEARSKASSLNLDISKLSESDLERFQNAQGRIGSSLSRLMSIHEQYPNLKADKHFSELQRQLQEIEGKISVARNRFNESAKIYNMFIRKFPKNIIASIFNFRSKPYFKSQEGAAIAPKVEF